MNISSTSAVQAATNAAAAPASDAVNVLVLKKALNAQAAVAHRSQVTSFLACADVQHAMQERGVNADDALQCVQSRGNYWALVALPPGRLPAYLNVQKTITAAQPL